MELKGAFGREVILPSIGLLKLQYGIICVLLVIGFILRASLMSKDLWLDEVWSYQTVQSFQSISDIFTRRWHDNSHLLNSLYLHFISPFANEYIYRLVSLVSGLLSCCLMGVVLPTENRWVTVLRVFLAVFCFSLVDYSAEARGYSSAIMFSLLALIAEQKSLSSHRVRYSLSYTAFMCLGFMAHFTFVYVAMGICLHYFVSQYKKRVNFGMQ